ncbi:hypothetical protein CYY_007207 [Polysphondylium violaceum]|uniref:EGF-like domain-containing protein n=1 Tax=Polysphondylium violaceum TaxID=133409 RepID=A0A8J4UY59_9MYCE|nr:hypothetical protein CYY_007207 [Polysphondylium violaceum]
MKTYSLLFFIFLFLFLFLRTTECAKPRVPYAKKISETYSENGACTLTVALSVENNIDPNIVYGFNGVQIAQPYQTKVQNYDVYSQVSFQLQKGTGLIELMIQTTIDSTIYTYEIGDYECIDAPSNYQVIRFNSTGEITARQSSSTIIKIDGYQRKSLLSASLIQGDSSFGLTFLQITDIDLSLFSLDFRLLVDGVTTNFENPIVRITQDEPLWTIDLPFYSRIKPWATHTIEVAAPSTPVAISIVNLNYETIMGISGNMRDQILYSNLPNNYVYALFTPVIGNDQNTKVWVKVSPQFYSQPASADASILAFNGVIPSQLFTVPFSKTVPNSVLNLAYNLPTSTYSTMINLELDAQSIVLPYKSSFRDGGYTFSFSTKDSLYPFGIVSGTYTDYKYAVSYLYSQTSPSLVWGVLYGYDNINNIPINLSATLADTNGPLIQNITLIHLEGPMYIVRFEITDDLSGFSCLDLQGGSFLMNASHIISGSTLNGVYEMLIQSTNSISTLNLMDNVGNSIIFTDFLPNTGQFFKALDGTSEIDAITILRFEHYDLDVSTQGQNNTLYFNFTGAGPTVKVMFLYTLTAFEYSDLSDLENFYEYDTVLELYKIDLYLPQGLYSANISYMVGRAPFVYNSDTLINIFGSSASLSVKNNDAYQLPPLLDSMEKSINNIINSVDDTIQVGWKLKFYSKRDIKSAVFHVTSDYDPEPRIFNFGPLTSNNFFYEFDVTFPVTGRERSQIFSISSGTIIDSQGYHSTVQESRHADAFMNFNGDATIPVTCPTPTNIDTVSPFISSWTTDIPTGYSTLSKDRNFTVRFTTQDSDSPLSFRHVPIVYMSTVIGKGAIINKQSLLHQCKTELLNKISASEGSYLATCEPEFGFGFPEMSVLSVYGIVDEYLNIGGSTASDIGGSGNTFLVDTTRDSFDPILQSHGKFTTDLGPLVIYGIKFGIQESPGVVEILNTLSNQFEPLSTSFNYYSSLVFSFNYQSNDPFTMRLKVEKDTFVYYSNELLIVPEKDPISSSSVSSSGQSLSSESSSSIPSSSSNTHSSSQSSFESSQGSKEVPKCPGTPQCGGEGKGQCLSTGGCKCTYPYYGESCTSVIIDIPTPTPNPNQPNTTIVIPIPGQDKGVTLSSLISVVALRELDQSHKEIQNYNFRQWIYTPLTDSQLLYQTSIINNNITTAINVTIQFFNTTEEIHFAGQNLTMNPSTIKYKISTSSYSFTNSQNYLQLIMSATFTATQNDGCTFEEFASTIDQSEYLKLQIDTHSLYGRFIKRGLLDNRIRSISNVLLNSEFGNTANDLKATQSFIGINIPYYRNTAVIDPDFSVLLDSNAASEKEGSKCPSSSSGLSAAKLAGIIVGAVAFAAIIIISTVYYFYKRKQSKQLVSKLKNINK